MPSSTPRIHPPDPEATKRFDRSVGNVSLGSSGCATIAGDGRSLDDRSRAVMTGPSSQAPPGISTST